jgi:hypothetical protein
MTIPRRIAAAAMLAGLAVGTASTVWADPPTMSGHYIETVTDPDSGQTATSDWYFTPCGGGCAEASFYSGGENLVSQATLVDGQWTMDADSNAVCADHSVVPKANSVHYTWDPNTLAGTLKATNKFAICGYSAPISFSNSIQFRQA